MYNQKMTEDSSNRENNPAVLNFTRKTRTGKNGKEEAYYVLDTEEKTRSDKTTDVSKTYNNKGEKIDNNTKGNILNKEV